MVYGGNTEESGDCPVNDDKVSSGTETLEPLGSVVKQALEQMRDLGKTQKEYSGISDFTVNPDHLPEQIQISEPGQPGVSRPVKNDSCVYTGFIGVDNQLNGLHPGELIVIGARPAMGKASFALNIAKYASMNKGKWVAVFTLEMPQEYIAMRVLCQEALVNPRHTREKSLTTDEWNRITKAAVKAMATPMYIDDTPGITPGQIRSRSLLLMKEKSLDLIVVDYLGLMQSDGQKNTREIISRLKAIALELNVPVVVTSQLKRADRNRPDKRPVLSDLPDPEFIEKNADVIMLLYREGYYNCFAEEKNITEVIIARQHNKPLETVELYWLDKYLLFANISRERQEEKEKWE